MAEEASEEGKKYHDSCFRFFILFNLIAIIFDLLQIAYSFYLLGTPANNELFSGLAYSLISIGIFALTAHLLGLLSYTKSTFDTGVNEIVSNRVASIVNFYEGLTKK
nr:hypothetical transcript [Hymenolepis microstoma]